MVRCPYSGFHQFRENPLKTLADDLWEKSSALTTELERFRSAYRPLTRKCDECVSVVEEDHYLHCLDEMDAAVGAFKRAKEKLEDKIREEKERRGYPT
jgi:Fe-S-cluster-containing dehydrogenase component